MKKYKNPRSCTENVVPMDDHVPEHSDKIHVPNKVSIHTLPPFLLLVLTVVIPELGQSAFYD